MSVQGPLIRCSFDGRGAMAQAYRQRLRVRILNAVEQAVSTAGADAPTTGCHLAGRLARAEHGAAKDFIRSLRRVHPHERIKDRQARLSDVGSRRIF
jgi:hypothetical protein